MNIDPWEIIGWIILGALALSAAIVAGIAILWLIAVSCAKLASWGHRNVAPEKGQEWTDRHDKRWVVKEVYPNGNIAIQAGSCSFGISPAEWKEYRKSRTLFLQS